MLLELRRAQKRMFRAFENSIFQFFASFWVTNFKWFSGKVKQSIQDSLNQTFVIGSFLEKRFGDTMTSKMNIVSVLKQHYSVFCRFLSDKVEIYFWKSEAKHSKLLKSKFGYKNLHRKWIWSNLGIKNECSDGLRKAFFRFLEIF